MKVLLVDDDNGKIDKVLSCLSDTGSVSRESIDVAYTAFDAKRLLSANFYDLLVVDIVLPFRAGDPPRPETAVDLMMELRDRPNLKKPRHIIGLTAYEEGLQALTPIFTQQTWGIIKYSHSSTSWAEQIANSVEYLARVSEQTSAPTYDVDACIITALDVPEYDAVLRNGWDWEAAEPLDDTSFFRRGRFISGGQTFSAVSAHCSRMGMITAALLASKLIAAKRPRIIAMAGICAGVKGKTNYGDPVIADPTWDWQSGKHVLKEGEKEFEIAPEQLPTPAAIRSRWNQLKADGAYWNRLKSDWPGPPDTDLKVRLGPAVSGSAVLANAEIVDEIKRQHRLLVGLDMEAYGVVSAAYMASQPRPMAFTCKSVCDFADEKKDDRWQTYAAYTSARAVREFFERYMHELQGITA